MTRKSTASEGDDEAARIARIVAAAPPASEALRREVAALIAPALRPRTVVQENPHPSGVHSSPSTGGEPSRQSHPAAGRSSSHEGSAA